MPALALRVCRRYPSCHSCGDRRAFSPSPQAEAERVAAIMSVAYDTRRIGRCPTAGFSSIHVPGQGATIALVTPDVERRQLESYNLFPGNEWVANT